MSIDLKPSIRRMMNKVYNKKNIKNTLSKTSVTTLEKMIKRIIKNVSFKACDYFQKQDSKKIKDTHIILAVKSIFTPKLFKNYLAEMTQFVNDHIKGIKLKDLDLKVSVGVISNLLNRCINIKTSLYAEIALTAVIDRILEDVISNAGSFEKKMIIFPKNIKNGIITNETIKSLHKFL